MGLRKATLADIPRCIKIAANAFVDEPIHAYRFPKRRQHWSDWEVFWYYHLQHSILQPGEIVWVWEDDEGVAKRTEIVAFCAWKKVGDFEASGIYLEKDSFIEEVQRKLATARATVYRAIHTDEAKADDELVNVFLQAMAKSVKEHWWDRRAGKLIPHWRVQYMATAPDEQGKGYGTDLLMWGLRQADIDGVVTGVNASSVGMQLYGKYGFQVLSQVKFGNTVGNICRRECSQSRRIIEADG